MIFFLADISLIWLETEASHGKKNSFICTRIHKTRKCWTRSMFYRWALGSNQAQEIIWSEAFRGGSDLTSFYPVLKVCGGKRNVKQKALSKEFLTISPWLQSRDSDYQQTPSADTVFPVSFELKDAATKQTHTIYFTCLPLSPGIYFFVIPSWELVMSIIASVLFSILYFTNPDYAQFAVQIMG